MEDHATFVSSLVNEETVSLNTLAKEIGVHNSTVWRWATAGCDGVILETLRVGGRRRTSRQAYERFLMLLNGGKVVTTKHRLKEIEAAQRKAAAMGI